MRAGNPNQHYPIIFHNEFILQLRQDFLCNIVLRRCIDRLYKTIACKRAERGNYPVGNDLSVEIFRVINPLNSWGQIKALKFLHRRISMTKKVLTQGIHFTCPADRLSLVLIQPIIFFNPRMITPCRASIKLKKRETPYFG